MATSTNLTELYQAALKLPLSDRADLAATLMESVKAAETHDRSDPWAEEIRRRVEDLESGKAVLLTWEEVERRLAERYAKAKSES
ncbi:MAG: addiction module protein [Planctomycetia bacterium]|nr:addiction module protein [Planctomycetia bacterium]